MNKKRYSAAEIANMRLKLLPKSKGGVISRATAEGWSFIEQKGVGGTRRMYEIPDYYFGKSTKPPISKTSNFKNQKTELFDLDILETAIAEVEIFLEENSLYISPVKKASLAVTIYDYVSKGASKKDINRMLKIIKI